MNKLKKVLQAYGTILALIMIVIVFSILRPKSFFTLRNFINISRQISLMVIISIGATLVMSINEFDLSAERGLNRHRAGWLIAGICGVLCARISSCILRAG